jgi:hypothetical protein
MRLYAIVALVLIALAPVAQSADAPLKPDPALTPGAADPAVTQANIATTICRKGGYTKSVRHTSAALKARIYAEHKIASHPAGAFEIDHLISLELGGADVAANLWPESYVTKPWNAHVKDKLEDWLHAQVCRGAMNLADARAALAYDWISAYRKYLGDIAEK